MLAVTMGDANGIGPEIILKSYGTGKLSGEFVVFGDFSAMLAVNEKLGYFVPLRRICGIKEYKAGAMNIFDADLLKKEQLTPGEVSKEVAAASRKYVVTATQRAQRDEFGGIVTLPVNKEAIRLTDPDFTGHTELIAGLCGQDNYTMMLVSKRLTVTHVSTHVSMNQAIENVKRRRIKNVVELTSDTLGRYLEKPRIAVAGLNAHAGEGGAFGRQEIDEIEPAVRDAIEAGVHAIGPLPPDTVFWRAVRGEFDAVVCMYHDQGHIPMKLLDFEGAVNVTLGLDVIRTSVDHGTAYDIAWQGKASAESFISAFQYAEQIQKR